MFRDLHLYKKISISKKLGVVNFLTLLLWTRFGYLGAIFSFLKLETIQNHPQDPYTILQRAIHSLTWYYELLSKGPSLVVIHISWLVLYLNWFWNHFQFEVEPYWIIPISTITSPTWYLLSRVCLLLYFTGIKSCESDCVRKRVWKFKICTIRLPVDLMAVAKTHVNEEISYSILSNHWKKYDFVAF